MNKTNRLKTLLKKGLVSAKELRDAGIPSSLVCTLVKRGEAVRVSRGVYSSADTGYSGSADYETLAMAVPRSVFCLLSALRLHDLTDENPHEFYLAIRHGSHPPRVSQPPACFVYRTEPLFSAAVEVRRSHGTAIRVYELEQTLADCFQYRNKIGPDVAVSALREAFEKGMVDRNKLWEAARRCRVTRIMRPYLEAFS